MVDYGSKRIPPLVLDRTTTNFSYLVAGGVQDAFVYANAEGRSVRVVGSLDFNGFTAAKILTVTVQEKIDGVNYRIIFSATYTVGTDPHPHVDFVTFRPCKITMSINVVEAGDIPVPRAIDVHQVAR